MSSSRKKERQKFLTKRACEGHRVRAGMQSYMVKFMRLFIPDTHISPQMCMISKNIFVKHLEQKVKVSEYNHIQEMENTSTIFAHLPNVSSFLMDRHDLLGI